MIYFLQPTTGGPVKIGHARHVERRQKQLEATYGRPLALLGVLEGGREEEADIHARLADHRIGRTEQFHPTPEVLNFIGRPLFANGNQPAEMMPTVGNLVPLISLKGSPEFAAWLEGLHKHTHIQKTVMFRLAIAAFAQQRGYPEPPQI